MKVRTAVVALTLAAAALVYSGFDVVRLQERPPRPTLVWEVAMLPFDGVAGTAGYTAARVTVIDTQGVCLYVVRSWGNNNVGLAPGVVAVPKTQLPSGTGCQ